MIGSVVECGFNSDDRVSGQRALLHTVAESFFNGREIVLGNRAAENLLCKDQIVRLARLKANPYVAELAVAARLFFVSSLNLNLFPDGLAVCNPRNTQLDLNAELGLELGAHNVKVLLAQSRKYLLVGLVVGGLGNGGILFDNAVESGDYLIFIAPLLGSYAHGKGGSGEIYSSCGNNIAGGAEGIAGFCARKF